MNERVARFIREKRIDSVAKLRVLLFLSKHVCLIASPQQLAEWVFFEPPLVEKIINDLHAVGVLVRIDEGFILQDEPTLRASLTALTQTFQSPLGRQELLNQIRSWA